LAPALELGAPGAELALYRGSAALGGTDLGEVRVWLAMRRSLRVKWRAASPPAGLVELGRSELVIDHPQLGAVSVPVDVLSSDASGTVPGSGLGGPDGIEYVRIQWVNLPSIHRSEAVEDERGSWLGRWRVESCGWHLTIDERRDLAEAKTLADELDEQYLVTHVGDLRRADGAPFDAATATDVLFAWQLAMSFALGRWVAPAVPVGFDACGRVWEQWAPWRCDVLRGSPSWWDTHTADDLADFVRAFLRAFLDPGRRDEVRLTAMHAISANHSGTTAEAKVMLAQAGLEYLGWVRLVLSGRTPRDRYKAMSAAERLRILIADAGIPVDVPDGLPGLVDLAASKGLDGPSAAAWVRNRLVHPKDPGEPYRIEGLVWQAAELLLEYSELLLLQGLGYQGRFLRRYPPYRWAHDSQLVPWAGRCGPSSGTDP
jgi:hypothetical protein